MKRLRNAAKDLWRQEAATASARLSLLKAEQKTAFDALKTKFAPLYGRLRGQGIREFLIPMWAKVNEELEASFLPSPPFSFLREPLIKDTMVIGLGGQELQETMVFLRANVPTGRLKKLLLEDPVGDPFLFAPSHLSSHNTLVHLRHLVEFSRATRCDARKIRTVVEWGGGYGGMAKIFKRQSLVDATYVIIDSPIFSCLQWLYLSTIFGEKSTCLIKNQDDSIKPKKINLLPLCFLKGRALRADLFLSTLGLCESSAYSQNYVRNQNWFQAKRLLLAYQTSNRRIPAADGVGQMARASGTHQFPLGKNRYYAFR